MKTTVKGMTGLNVRGINRRLVLSELYRSRGMTKQQLVEGLHMSLSTVDQNLRALQEAGILSHLGFCDSTGGRKARLFGVNARYRTAAGLGILKGSVHFCACDLFGRELCREQVALPYRNDDAYLQQLAQCFADFLQKNEIEHSRLLPLHAAIQGLVDVDGREVTFGPLLHNQGFKAERLEQALGLELRLCHDAYAAAFYEIWQRSDLTDAALFLLNRNFGGALIINHQVVKGRGGWAGTLEHFCLDPNGPRCYCGCRGCVEEYCSADALLKRADLTADEFFLKLREGDAACLGIWQDYLKALALVMRNSLTVVDGMLILSGYLVPYMNEDDTAELTGLINENLPFELSADRIYTGNSGDSTPALGAALCSLDQFLQDEVMPSAAAD